MSGKVTNKKFVKTWIDVCKRHESKLLEEWESPRAYTDIIFEGVDRENQSIVAQIGVAIKKNVFREYYHLDAVFYDKKDRIPQNPHQKTRQHGVGDWIKRIPIAFEHENNVNSAYQEVSHLLTTNADIKVLVTYAAEQDTEKYANDFASIVKDVPSVPICLIFGYCQQSNEEKWEIKWKAYTLNPETGQATLLLTSGGKKKKDSTEKEQP